MSNVVNSIIWFILLWFIGFPVGFFCAGLWIFFSALEACFGDACADLIKILEAGMNLPKKWAKNLVSGASLK